jgi:CRISPR-associated endonuclease/helicase Cas3
VVSTQVIEAGVDIDFPRVFRALGPLDSIVQAGGRCNREGGLRDASGRPCRGEVVIFRPADDAMPPGQYRLATGEALTLLGEYPADLLATNPDIFARYFSALYDRVPTDAQDIQALRADWRFDSVAKAARVIEDGGRSVLVPYRDGRRWVRRLRRLGTFDVPTLRRLQRYAVNLRPNDFAEAERLGLVTPLFGGKPDGPWVLDDGCYHDELGVVIGPRPLEDFLV